MYKRDKLFMVVLIGPGGAGKTTLAKFIKDQIDHVAHVACDNISRFISESQEASSRKAISRSVAIAMTDEYLQNGISVVVEQGMDNKEVKRLHEIANKNGADFFLYRIEARHDIRIQRVIERAIQTNKPIMTKEKMDWLLERYQENTYPSNNTFDSEKLSTEEIAKQILLDLKV